VLCSTTTDSSGPYGALTTFNVLTANPIDISPDNYTKTRFNTFTLNFTASASGTFSIQWAQNSSNATPTYLKKGSILEYIEQ
jgi:hypothetical protein